jgi:hypothetical protein
MAHCYYHALSSVRKWGGTVDDYLPLHQWFDQSKAILADPDTRALRHHAEGIFMLGNIFGETLVNADGRVRSGASGRRTARARRLGSILLCRLGALDHAAGLDASRQPSGRR